MSTAPQLLQVVLRDFQAYRAGGQNALSEMTRLRQFLNRYNEDDYPSVLFQLLISINARQGWRFVALANERVLAPSELAALEADIFKYRVYSMVSLEAKAGFDRYLNPINTPYPGTLDVIAVWGQPTVAAQPVPYLRQYSDNRYAMVCTPGNPVVFNVPNNIATARLRITRLAGGPAGQGAGNLTVRGALMVGNNMDLITTAGDVVTLTNAAGAYDIVSLYFSDIYVNRRPTVIDDFGASLAQLENAPPGSMARRTRDAYLGAVGAVTNADAFAINDLPTTSPLWYCADELLGLAPA